VAIQSPRRPADLCNADEPLHGGGACKNPCINAEIASDESVDSDVANGLRTVSPGRALFFNLQWKLTQRNGKPALMAATVIPITTGGVYGGRGTSTRRPCLGTQAWNDARLDAHLEVSQLHADDILPMRSVRRRGP
jgi:hypothetical protein